MRLSGVRASGRAGRQALVVGVLITSGCAKLLGVDGYRVGDAPAEAGLKHPAPAACGAFEYPTQCRTCLHDKCCGEADRCAQDANCETWAGCQAACPIEDAECRAKCFGSVAKTRAVRDYAECLTSECGTECLSCGDFGATFGPECAHCQSDPNQGCRQAAACLEDEECRRLVGCMWGGCTTWDTDPGCRMSCQAEHPKARDPFVAWAVNTVVGCTTACGWGTHWGCADHVIPAGPAGGETTRRSRPTGLLEGWPSSAA